MSSLSNSDTNTCQLVSTFNSNIVMSSSSDDISLIGNLATVCSNVPDRFKWKFERVHKDAILPTKSTAYSAGYDLYAPQTGIVPAHGKAIIPIGWKVRLPKGSYGRIAPRSGLAWKNHLDVGAGVIDEDYSNEVGVIIFNHANTDFIYAAGDRIAQMIIEACYTDYVPTEVDTLPSIESSRTGGYGSTGV